MRLIHTLLTAVISGLVASSDVVEDVDLYNEAQKILSGIPMFRDRAHNDNGPAVLELQMDFDFELERMKYRVGMEKLSTERKEALELLQSSAEMGNVDSAYLLADMFMFGNYSIPTNGSLALEYYEKVTSLSPNATAAFNLGVIYATGLFGEVELNQAKANLYFQLAFELGDLRAAMVLGNRYVHGIALPYDCERAHFYYQIVADEMKKFYDSQPLGGPHLDSFNIRVSDFQDGIYGKSVGDMESSLTRKSNRFDHILQVDSLGADDYSIYDQLYFNAITNYEGSYTKQRNFTKAYRYARLAYDDGHADFRSLNKYEKFFVARSAYLMGHMHMRGEGFNEPDYDQALLFLKKSLEIYPTADAHVDLGMIYEFGPEEHRDLKAAEEHYKKASQSTSSAKLYNYGRMLLQKNKPEGAKLIATASQHLEIPALYHQAQLLETTEKENKCLQTVGTLKYYVESFDPMLTSLEWAFHELMNGRSGNALIGYAMAAEQGLEMAQASAAFMMYQLAGLLEDPPKIPQERREMAKVYTTRSSIQHNLDSTVLLGDMYFDEGEFDKAVAAYEAASGRRSSQASFNLGWLHEMGFGVEQDFHLAKRYYDLALDKHPKAYLPVQIALLRLRFKGLVSNIFGKKITSVDPNKDQKRSWADWIKLYQKVRGKTQLPSDYEAEVENTLSPEDTEPVQDMIFNEDVMVIIFFAGAFAMFWTVYMIQQRQIRRRRDDNEPQPRPEIRVQFGFFAI